jgi:enamine deaminase RidA (YjgF/YER057c/UK114 family)
MPKRHIQPPELFGSEKLGFTQVVTSDPGTLVFVSGQTAMNREFRTVGGTDLAAQAEQALANLGDALSAAGASPADVTSLRVYVAGYEPAHAAVIGPIFGRFFSDGPPPAQTLLGVQTLAMPELLIEIEATAVIAG